VALLVARRTNNRKVIGSRPTKVVCITVLTGNRVGWTVRCGRPPLLLPSCRKLEFRLSALMYSDLAWENGKSGRQSWCYADAFRRSIISGTIYHWLVLWSRIRDRVSDWLWSRLRSYWLAWSLTSLCYTELHVIAITAAIRYHDVHIVMRMRMSFSSSRHCRRDVVTT